MATAAGVRLRPIALPTEHGGWGFIIEPILLGLLIAPSVAGVILGLATFGFFLLHQPLKIALKDHLKGRRVPRTVVAERFALGYGGLGLLGMITILFIAEPLFLAPLLLALPLAFVQIYYDLRNKSRAVPSEIAGAVALGSVASAIMLLGGKDLTPAFIIWGLLIARTIPAILYVRARLRIETNRAWQALPVIVSHAVALLAVVALTVSGLATIWATLALLILTGRALLGISPYRQPARPAQIGVREMILGFLTAGLYAIP